MFQVMMEEKIFLNIGGDIENEVIRYEEVRVNSVTLTPIEVSTLANDSLTNSTQMAYYFYQVKSFGSCEIVLQ